MDTSERALDKCAKLLCRVKAEICSVWNAADLIAARDNVKIRSTWVILLTLSQCTEVYACLSRDVSTVARSSLKICLDDRLLAFARAASLGASVSSAFSSRHDVISSSRGDQYALDLLCLSTSSHICQWLFVRVVEDPNYLSLVQTTESMEHRAWRVFIVSSCSIKCHWWRHEFVLLWLTYQLWCLGHRSSSYGTR